MLGESHLYSDVLTYSPKARQKVTSLSQKVPPVSYKGRARRLYAASVTFLREVSLKVPLAWFK